MRVLEGEEEDKFFVKVQNDMKLKRKFAGKGKRGGGRGAGRGGRGEGRFGNNRKRKFQNDNGRDENSHSKKVAVESNE